MLQASKTYFRFCIFRGSLRDVKGDSTTTIVLFLLLLLLELNPLVSLFTDSERASKLLEHRATIWLLALTWHLAAVAMIFVVLKWKQRVSRLRETLASYFGVFILFQLMGIFLQLTSHAALPTLMRTILVFLWLSWSCGVFGYVFGSALELKFYQGIVVALAVNILSYVLAFALIAVLFSDTLVEILQ